MDFVVAGTANIDATPASTMSAAVSGLVAGDLVLAALNTTGAPDVMGSGWSNIHNAGVSLPGVYWTIADGGETSVDWTFGVAVTMAVGLVLVYRNTNIDLSSSMFYYKHTGSVGFVAGVTPISRAESAGTNTLDATDTYLALHFAYFDSPNNLSAISASSSQYTVRGTAECSNPGAGGGQSFKRLLTGGEALVTGVATSPYATTAWAFTGTNTAPGTYLTCVGFNAAPGYEETPPPNISGLDLQLRRAEFTELPYEIHTRML
jgi:hypothetical protein